MPISPEALIPTLQTIYDPEIPVNIYDLGLVYEINISDENDVRIVMTLTSPACPAAGFIADQVREALERAPGVRSAQVEVVFEPRWTRDRMSAQARAILG